MRIAPIVWELETDGSVPGLEVRFLFLHLFSLGSSCLIGK